ncbi:permeases of the major facilitator superfamily [Rickettsia endosymbiont of Ixodes pacificus]|nr:permeases of the major facilitator superfamily [Rickettsia endosymbiont of Ixodes pacificus]
MIGGLARTRLRETPEFADAKRRVKNILEKANLDISKLEENPLWNQKVSIKTSLALFCIQCADPVYCGNILKNSFNYTPAQIIHQNFLVSIVHVASYIIITYLSYYIYPLIILRVKAIIFGIFILLFPYLLNYSTSGFY